MRSSRTEAQSDVPVQTVLDAKLGQMLVRETRLSLRQLDDLLSKPSLAQAGRPAWRFVAGGVMDENEWSQRIANLFGLSAANVDDFHIDRQLVIKVGEETCRRYQLLPLAHSGAEVYVAITDPSNLNAIDHVKGLLAARVQTVVVPPSQLERAFRQLFLAETTADVQHIADDPLDNMTDVELTQLKQAGESGKIIELVDRLLQHAISVGASDIHIEPFDSVQVRFRVDGVLRDGPVYPLGVAPWIVSRIKVMARLDIAERFVPQDGRIRLRHKDRELDMRISCLPVARGEKIVIRVLAHDTMARPLDQLGFTTVNLERFRRQLYRPYGMVLVTGPTGSGKTTTLYAALRERATSEVNVVTVEDPIEYEIKGLNQVPVNPKRGVTFAGALRAILRQDPDVILVGEIRDRETGLTAAEAAVTGHLLLSTLHTNDAASSIHRLLEMDVPRHLVAPALNAVLAQRLVRLICSKCKETYLAAPALLDELVPGMGTRKVHLARGAGCAACDQTGYAGRAGIHEVLVIDEAMRQMISDRAPTGAIRDAAVRGGMVDLRTACLEKLFAGETTVEEMARVVSA